MSTHPGRRLALAITLGALLTLGATTTAGATKSPSFLLDGGDHWFTHDSGYPVVLGPAEVNLGKRAISGDLSATIHPDDYSMPAPGECESAIAFVYVEGTRNADTWLSSAGEVCGLHLDEPNVVTHTFVGTATIEESGPRKLEGQEAFLEIRLAVDGRANVFATTW
ncbi:MAG: hypothetical protein ABWZ52_01090, partial [Acidimicrobiales bacterium]